MRDSITVRYMCATPTKKSRICVDDTNERVYYLYDDTQADPFHNAVKMFCLQKGLKGTLVRGYLRHHVRVYVWLDEHTARIDV